MAAGHQTQTRIRCRTMYILRLAIYYHGRLKSGAYTSSVGDYWTVGHENYESYTVVMLAVFYWTYTKLSHPQTKVLCLSLWYSARLTFPQLNRENICFFEHFILFVYILPCRLYYTFFDFCPFLYVCIVFLQNIRGLAYPYKIRTWREW